MTFKPTYWTQLTRSINNMTGNCLFDPFVLKYIHIRTYFVKKRDSYEIFRLSMKISWEPGSQVPCHYPTLSLTKAKILPPKIWIFIHMDSAKSIWGTMLSQVTELCFRVG